MNKADLELTIKNKHESAEVYIEHPTKKRLHRIRMKIGTGENVIVFIPEKEPE